MKKKHQRMTKRAVIHSATTANAGPATLKDEALSQAIGGLTPEPPQLDPPPDSGTTGPS
jgi:hypothetical protein